MKATTEQPKTLNEGLPSKAKNQASVSTILSEYNSPVQKKENKTGLPDNLKSGIENLSGHSMDDVKVHYGSSKPAELQAHAYAQGTNIHVAPGQEQHLPHEAWHVVQQKQGRVKPTMQMKGKININDDTGLETEADVMGAKALSKDGNQSDMATSQLKSITAGSIDVAQLKKIVSIKGKFTIVEDNNPLPAVDVDALEDSQVGAYFNLEAQIGGDEEEAARQEAIDNAREQREAAEAARVEAARRLAAAKAAAKAEREKGLKKYPKRVSRKDNNFAKKVNRTGQGKAHLLPTGLAPAGDVSIRPVDQLNQDHVDKGKSNLISFTGPAPKDGGQVYGGADAPKMDVKFKKIARAIARKKPDVAHLELHTSAELLAMEDTIAPFVKKDDEHQIRVKGGAIPKRMLVSSNPALNLPDEHDSDSDSDAD